MSGAFDPYHRWLGIPAAEQPPHHYRLLGLVPFEGDPEVIRDAAERQMAHVRGYALGQHAELSQRILNELGAAKACLLEPARKAEYDRRLRRDLAASKPAPRPIVAERSQPARTTAAPPVARSVPRPIKQPPALPAEAVDQGGPARLDLRAMDRKRLIVLGGGAVGLLCVLAIGALVFFGGGDKTSRGGAKDRIDPDAPALRILPIRKQAVFEGEELAVSVQVEERNVVAGELRYGLNPGPAAGATIDPKSGRITWTPGERHGPGVYPITVWTAAEGSNDLKDEATFEVHVQEHNETPLIYAVEDRTLKPGETSSFAVTASDEDLPPNKLRFALAGAPNWVEIDPSTGTVTCTPTSEHAGTSCQVTVRVIDNGLPMPRHADTTMRLAVAAAAGQPQQAGSSPPVAQQAGSSPPAAQQAGSSLTAAQQAVASGDFQKAWQHLQAVQETTSPEDFWPLERFLSTVRDEYAKVEALDELSLGGGVIASVADRDAEKLTIMWEGRPRAFTISELPWELSVALAQRGLRPSDPGAAISIAAFLAVDVEGDYQEFVRRCTQAGLAKTRPPSAAPPPGAVAPFAPGMPGGPGVPFGPGMPVPPGVPFGPGMPVAPGMPFGPGAPGPAPTMGAGGNRARTSPFGGNPTQRVPAPAPTPVRKSYSITLPSGIAVDSSLFDLSKQSIANEARTLFRECMNSGRSRSATHFAAGLLHPDGSVLAMFRQKAARRGIDPELDGIMITFFPSPETAGPQAALAALSPWEAAHPRMCATYKDGRKNGWLKSWDEQFRKVYWCEYVGDRRNGLCCLFEQDELAMVAECEGDQVRAVHRISGGKLQGSFRDESEVKGDAEAGPVWARLVQAERDVGEQERSIMEKKREEEEKLKEILRRTISVQKRENIIGRSQQRDAAKSSFFGGQWRGATGRSGVQ